MNVIVCIFLSAAVAMIPLCALLRVETKLNSNVYDILHTISYESTMDYCKGKLLQSFGIESVFFSYPFNIYIYIEKSSRYNGTR